ncbi:MAG: tyrosyl-tRNA synthetase [Trizodia sp. TS-e1964]|nr:MAG: tyrosyl-tRNA synthetase [Trizodia sp. TS-e1964]
MIEKSVGQNVLAPRLPLRIGRRALYHPKRSFSSTPGQYIGQKYLAKLDQAEKEWQAQAVLIRQGKKESMLSILESRGLVDTIAGDRNKLDQLFTSKRIGAYVGIDPTAPSLHVGHLLPLMSLFWLYVHGYQTVSLLGGATASIGDPTGRTKSRAKEVSSLRKAHMVSMHYQLKKLWRTAESYGNKHGYRWEWAWRRGIENNSTWLNKIPVMDFLKILGSGIRIGTMLGRDTYACPFLIVSQLKIYQLIIVVFSRNSVRNRLEKGDGMSLAEFTYPTLQAWDWWHLYKTRNIQIQIGGSDQFGNIIAGMDAIKHIQPPESEDMAPLGFTSPLLTTSSGEKFGKSAGNAIWLDKEMTSSFDLYQFFLRTTDADVSRYLKMFTFLPIPQIDALVEEHMKTPEQRKAQHVLAREVIWLVHGERESKDAEKQHRTMFGSKSIPASLLNQSDPVEDPNAPGYVPTTHLNAPAMHIKLPRSLVINQSIPRILFSAGLVASRSKGQQVTASQGAYIGSRADSKGSMSDDLTFTPVKLWNPAKTESYIIDNDLLILRVGKWKVKIIKIISDEEFEQLGLSAPGWKEDAKPKADNAEDDEFC